MSAARNAAEIKNSTKLVITVLTITMRRGKYILDIRFPLDTRLSPLSDMAFEKKVQGSIPQRTSSGYGTPPDGIFPNFPKTNVSTSIVSSGRISDQPTP